jgi:predicted HTH domain antitoxin
MSLLIPDDLVKVSGLSETELLQELVLLLFQREKLSLGKASHILGMTQLEFGGTINNPNCRGIVGNIDGCDLQN